MANQWNSENVARFVEELVNAPEDIRMKAAGEIRSDLKQYAINNFEFSDLQRQCMELLPKEYYSETGYLLARAIETQAPITTTVTDDSTPVAARKRGDKVEGGWNQKEGFNIKYTFEF